MTLFRGLITLYDSDAASGNQENGFTYRRDSRLLIVSGTPNEDEKREGIAYLLWTGRGFKTLKTYARAQVCRVEHAGKNP